MVMPVMRFFGFQALAHCSGRQPGHDAVCDSSSQIRYNIYRLKSAVWRECPNGAPLGGEIDFCWISSGVPALDQ